MWLTISLALVNRLGWVAKNGPSNVGGATMWMVSKGPRMLHLGRSLFHLGWSMLHFHGMVVASSCISLTLVDVMQLADSM